MIKTDILIVGGGVAGLSTAYFLKEFSRADVTVLEQERRLGGHASGRNAGMLRQALSDPVLARLARESRPFFEGLRGRGWPDLSLWKNGSLILSDGPKAAEVEKIARTMSAVGIAHEWLDARQVRRKASPVKGAAFSRALFCPSDAMLDLAALLEGFERRLRSDGTHLVKGLRLKSIRPVPDGFIVRAGQKSFHAKILVNAAGAWAGWVAERAQAMKIPLAAYRRHLFEARGSKLEAGSRKRWPFVWDIGRDFYFRPTNRSVLVSGCDKTLERRGDRSEKVVPAARTLVLDKMRGFSPAVAKWKIGEAVSGLRTMTPDGRFVIGPDSKNTRFFWVAGLGGHGVTTCFSVGRMAARMILGKKVDPKIKKALSPERFRS